MNLRLFTFVMLASASSLTAHAGKSTITLNKGDFISAERLSRNGESIVSVKLSKSGKAKLKKLNESAVGQEVHSEVAGVATDFNLKEPILGDGLEMGPYPNGDATKVIAAINKK